MFWSLGLATSYGKRKPLCLCYLYYQSAYDGQQTWQEDNLPWWVPSYRAILNSLITWSCERSREKLKPLYFQYHSIWPPDLAWWWLTWSSFHPLSSSTYCSLGFARLRDKLKPVIISPLLQCLWPPNLGGWWLTLRGTYHPNSLRL